MKDAGSVMKMNPSMDALAILIPDTLIVRKTGTSLVEPAVLGVDGVRIKNGLPGLAVLVIREVGQAIAPTPSAQPEVGD